MPLTARSHFCCLPPLAVMLHPRSLRQDNGTTSAYLGRGRPSRRDLGFRATFMLLVVDRCSSLQGEMRLGTGLLKTVKGSCQFFGLALSTGRRQGCPVGGQCLRCFTGRKQHPAGMRPACGLRGILVLACLTCQPVVHSLQPGGVGVANPGDLHRGRPQGHAAQLVVRRVPSELHQNVHLVLLHLHTKSGGLESVVMPRRGHPACGRQAGALPQCLGTTSETALAPLMAALLLLSRTGRGSEAVLAPIARGQRQQSPYRQPSKAGRQAQDWHCLGSRPGWE